MFITSKNKYLSNGMKIFGTCSIPLSPAGQFIMINTEHKDLDSLRKLQQWKQEKTFSRTPSRPVHCHEY